MQFYSLLRWALALFLFIYLPTYADQPPVYPPYVIQLNDDPDFDEITFKDVTQNHSTQSKQVLDFDPLSSAIQSQLNKSGLRATITERPELKDPNQHLLCLDRHLYIDFWFSTAPDRVGFSLWKGCDERDMFKKKEIIINDLTATASIEKIAKSVASNIQTLSKKSRFSLRN